MKATFINRILTIVVWLWLPTYAVSQTWTASAVGEGTFYLYNVGNDGFLRGGNDYDTRASLTQQGGIPVTLSAGSGDNNYLIATSPTYNGLYLGNDGNNGFVDFAKGNNNYCNWTFVAVDGQDNTYILQSSRDSKYLVGHATDATKTSLTATLPTDDKGYWKLATREALLANFSNATQDSPIDATFLILDPYFGRVTNVSGVWTGGVTHGGYESGASQNYCIERFNTTFDVYQTLSGLPNGIYGIQCQGFYRIGGRTDATTRRNNGQEVLNAKYYINNSEGGLMSIFDGSYAKSYTSGYNENSAYTVNGEARYLPNTLSQAANCLRKDDYQNPVVTAVVTDGNIRLGVKKTVAVGSDWTIFDNFTLTYYGIDLSALVTSYEEQLAAAKALLSETMHASVKTALSNAITAAETDVNTSSQEWLEATLSALGTALGNAQASNALYTGPILNAVNGMKAQSTSDDVKTAVQAKYDNGEYASAADVYAYYQPQEIAALGTANNTVFTSAIINPGFELGNTDGWSIEVMGDDTGARRTDNATYSNTLSEGTYLFNTWTNSVKTLDISQAITGLPNGYYTMQCVVAGYGDSSPITLTANGKGTSVSPSNSNVDAEVANGHTMTLERILVSDGTLTFKLQNTGKGKTLLKADDFRLTLTESYGGLDSYTDLAYDLNIENGEVTNYLASTTYTESTATVIGSYATDAALRNDQPATIMIPLPAQENPATLSLALNSTYTDAETFTVAAGSVLYEVKNLLPGNTYYYKVEASGDVVANGTITTSGQLRMIKAEGIANMRDLGGWTNADGNRIRYGKLFRGSELRGGKTYTASDADLAMLKNQLHIGAEVDLREDKDFANGTMNASAIDGATYTYVNLSRWSEDALNFDNAKFKSAFDLVLAALKADKAAYFHCIFGADRTGCFAMLLEGLLGLPVDQLYKDYELTSFSSAGLRDKTGIDHKLQYIKALQGDNLQQKFYNYWRGAVGVSESDLNNFIDIMIDGTSSITSATLADLPAKAVADGDYYIYLPTQQKFLGRGRNFGTQGVPDNYGVPATVTTNGVGVTTIKFLDNNLYFGSDGMTDKAEYYNSVSWSIEQRGDDLVMKSHNGKYFYMKEGTRAYVDAASVTNADAVTFKSRTEHDALVAATQNANILAAATAAGITATDLSDFNVQLSTNYTARHSTATIKSATSGNTTDWVLSELNAHGETANYGNAYNVGNYGGELYQKNASVSQTVTVPHAGLYKLTLNAFYRQGSKELCYAAGQKGFEMSNAYVSVNGTYFTQIPSWYSDCASEINPNTTEQAKSLMDAGKYAVELFFYADETKTATITINVPGFTPWAWCLFNNFTLTEYAKKVTLSEDADEVPEACDFADVTATRTITANKWATLCLPFNMAVPDGWEVREMTSVTEAAGIYTLHFTEADEIQAGKPYMVKTTENVTTINAVSPVVNEPATTTIEGVSMIGTFSSGYIPAAAYFVSNNTFYQAADNTNSIKAFRAYFNVSGGGNVKGLFIDYDSVQTAIPGIINSKSGNGKYYDLSGRVLNRLKHGITIVRMPDGTVQKILSK